MRMDNRDVLIERLAADLKPIKPLQGVAVWTIAAAWTILAVVAVVAVYRPRPEWAEGLSAIAARPLVIGKPVLFLTIGVLAMLELVSLARPTGRLRRGPVLGIFGLSALVVVWLAFDLLDLGPDRAFAGIWGANVLCVATIVIGGIGGLFTLWALWLRRCASPEPKALGIFAGLAASALTAGAYAVHCNMDAPVYLIAMYGGAIAIVSVSGQEIGKRFLKW